MSFISKKYLESQFNFTGNYKILDGTHSPNYNCISHTIGLNDRWSWPGDNINYWPIDDKSETIESFDKFYEYHGFIKIDLSGIYVGQNKVILYAKDEKPKHTSIQILNNTWESKMGGGEIVRHDPFDFENSIYGEIVRIYEKK